MRRDIAPRTKSRAIIWLLLPGLLLVGTSLLSAPGTFAISPSVIATQEQSVTFNLTASPDGGWQQGFDFRNTSSFVTDPAGDTYVLPTTIYPTKSNGVTFGWAKNSAQGRDRNAKLDPRLAGVNFVNNGSPATFYVD